MQMTNALAPKLVAEFIATFALVFIGVGAAAVVGEGAGLSGIAATAFAPGLTIMVFVFAYGTVSGSHLNPAASLGVLAAGAMSLVDSVGYIVAQLMGAIAAALALAAVLGGVAIGLGTPALAHDLALGTTTTVTITPAAGFAIEALLAFLLLTTVLSTAVAGRDGNLAPLVIGVTVTVDRVMTATAFNPARAIGPMIVTGKLDHLWLYVLAPWWAPSSRPWSTCTRAACRQPTKTASTPAECLANSFRMGRPQPLTPWLRRDRRARITTSDKSRRYPPPHGPVSIKLSRNPAKQRKSYQATWRGCTPTELAFRFESDHALRALS
jgi:aquaporin Z